MVILTVVVKTSDRVKKKYVGFRRKLAFVCKAVNSKRNNMVFQSQLASLGIGYRIATSAW